VWTIWVATIAFIGAGFVGWGSYKYGSKASAIGQVGSIEISNAKLNFTYQNLYERYNELFKGKFDEEQAKKMGLTKQAFRSLASQAQLLNLAKQYGIVVSEKELADYIASMNVFHENGVFNKQVYNTYLQNRRLKSSTFESILSDELTFQKLLSLIEHPAVQHETKTVASALSIEDKIGYQVLSPDDMQVALSEESIQKAWETNKDKYMSPRMYALSLLWTETKEINVSDQEIRDFYDKNSFNYVDANGRALPFDQVKGLAAQDLRVKKGKKQALLDYIALKKGNKSSTQTQTVAAKDPILSKEIWDEIFQKNTGTLLKPRIVGSRYATVKIERVIEPAPMPYEKAKSMVSKELKLVKSVEMMEEKAATLLKEIDKADLTTSDYISLTKKPRLLPLDQENSLQFVEKLFTSSEKKGIIRLSKAMVVYRIVDQRIRSVDENLTQTIQNETDQIKKRVFENALFKKLNEQFPIRAYAKGL
jgi:peptidyl-prolyl cis-trans isomerase D